MEMLKQQEIRVPPDRITGAGSYPKNCSQTVMLTVPGELSRANESDSMPARSA